MKEGIYVQTEQGSFAFVSLVLERKRNVFNWVLFYMKSLHLYDFIDAEDDDNEVEVDKEESSDVEIDPRSEFL